MNETFKSQLAAFARDVREICHASGHDGCANCPLRFNRGKDGCAASGISEEKYNFDQAIAAVEAYRKRKKPCAEVIYKALEVYVLEVEVERIKYNGFKVPAAVYAKNLAYDIEQDKSTADRQYTVHVLSAKRFALESHRESDKEDTE